jgi:hypothetical protein
MSTIIEEEPATTVDAKKRRGRPPKKEEERIVQDKSTYMKAWHQAKKDDPEHMEKRRQYVYAKHKRHQELYTFIQSVMKTNAQNLMLPESIQTIKRLVLINDD